MKSARVSRSLTRPRVAWTLAIPRTGLWIEHNILSFLFGQRLMRFGMTQNDISAVIAKGLSRYGEFIFAIIPGTHQELAFLVSRHEPYKPIQRLPAHVNHFCFIIPPCRYPSVLSSCVDQNCGLDSPGFGLGSVYFHGPVYCWYWVWWDARPLRYPHRHPKPHPS